MAATQRTMAGEPDRLSGEMRFGRPRLGHPDGRGVVLRTATSEGSLARPGCRPQPRPQGSLTAGHGSITHPAAADRWSLPLDLNQS